MRRLALAYNPVSGNATFKNRLDEMIEAFQRRGILLYLYRTKKDGNGELVDFLREARAEGVLAAGGDGTLHEVVNLVVKEGVDIPVGIIGSGTSNDFATYLNINENMEAYFDCIAEGRTRSVDLGRVGEEYFINVASAGMMTSIAHEVNVKWKNALGRMAYYLKGIGEIPKLRTIRLHVEADDATHELDAFLFVVINSSVVGSMKHVADDVEADDGKLDFLAIRKQNVAQLVKLTADLIAGKSVSRQNAVLHLQSRNFLISASEDVTSDLDGEIGPPLPLRIETMPKAVRIYA